MELTKNTSKRLTQFTDGGKKMQNAKLPPSLKNVHILNFVIRQVEFNSFNSVKANTIGAKLTTFQLSTFNFSP